MHCLYMSIQQKLEKATWDFFFLLLFVSMLLYLYLLSNLSKIILRKKSSLFIPCYSFWYDMAFKGYIFFNRECEKVSAFLLHFLL